MLARSIRCLIVGVGSRVNRTPAPLSTHVTSDTLVPHMVDVTAKVPTLRTATAKGRVAFPPSLSEEIRTRLKEERLGGSSCAAEVMSKKGPVIGTAIVAGTMAVKDTPHLIPFCHSLGVERCDFAITLAEDCSHMDVVCTVGTTNKTGVEMEAMTG